MLTGYDEMLSGFSHVLDGVMFGGFELGIDNELEPPEQPVNNTAETIATKL